MRPRGGRRCARPVRRWSPHPAKAAPPHGPFPSGRRMTRRASRRQNRRTGRHNRWCGHRETRHSAPPAQPAAPHRPIGRPQRPRRAPPSSSQGHGSAEPHRSPRRRRRPARRQPRAPVPDGAHHRRETDRQPGRYRPLSVSHSAFQYRLRTRPTPNHNNRWPRDRRWDGSANRKRDQPARFRRRRLRKLRPPAIAAPAAMGPRPPGAGTEVSSPETSSV